MRRRRDDAPSGVPEQLLTFRVADWAHPADRSDPEGPLDPATQLAFIACGRWEAAREEWFEQHGWPTGALERLKERLAVRRHIHGRSS